MQDREASKIQAIGMRQGHYSLDFYIPFRTTHKFRTTRGLRCMRLLDVRLSSNDPHREYYFDLHCCNCLLAYLSELFVQAGLIQYTQLMAECNRIAR